jgi:hypothetical protein
LVDIKHKAFLDIEYSLTKRLQAAWEKHWHPLAAKLDHAIGHRKFDAATQIINNVDFKEVLKDQGNYLRVLGMSSLLLGASRIREPKETVVYKKPPTAVLDNAIIQTDYILTHNSTVALHQQGHLAIAQLQHKLATDNLVYKDDSDFSVTADLASTASNYIGLASSLMVSRLANFGFLSEAVDSNIEYYQISAILDERTCPVCEALDGTVFSVADGIAHAINIMNAVSPDSLRTISPWPSQNDASVNNINDSSIQDLIDQGLALGPYHPWCRCIAVVADPADVQDQMGSDSQPALDDQLLADTLTQALLSDRASGNLDDLQNQAENLATLLGVSVAAVLGAPLNNEDTVIPSELDDVQSEELSLNVLDVLSKLGLQIDEVQPPLTTQLGLTRNQLADKLGVEVADLPTVLADLAQVLGVSVAALIGNNGNDDQSSN